MQYDTKILNATDAVPLGARLISEGEVVAFATETVYGLGADACNEAAVSRIFEIKGRPQDNPLIVHICDKEHVKLLCRNISPTAHKIMDAFFPGAFTAVLAANDVIPKSVRAGLDTLAIRMPAHEHTRRIISLSGKYIAAPSANISGRPSPTNAQDVYSDLQGKIPLILDGGSCKFGVESTVCDLTGEVPIILRPGAVTREMISQICPTVKLAPGVLKHTTDVALSPGMKYTHYSPVAQVYVVRQDEQSTLANKVKMLYDMFVKRGNSPVIFSTSNESYPHLKVRLLGADPASVANRVFSALRRADADGFDTVLFESLPEEGMGLAVMNRVLRSAGFKVL